MTLQAKITFAIFFITVAQNTAYGLIAPFFPQELSSRGMTQKWIGLIFASYPLSTIIFSPIIGKLYPYTGRRSLILFGVFLMGSVFLCYSAIQEISNMHLFIGMNALFRMLQGLASALTQTTIYSVCTNFYGERREAMIGYCEALQALGFIIGPILGSFIYDFGGL